VHRFKVHGLSCKKPAICFAEWIWQQPQVMPLQRVGGAKLTRLVRNTLFHLASNTRIQSIVAGLVVDRATGQRPYQKSRNLLPVVGQVVARNFFTLAA